MLEEREGAVGREGELVERRRNLAGARDKKADVCSLISSKKLSAAVQRGDMASNPAAGGDGLELGLLSPHRGEGSRLPIMPQALSAEFGRGGEGSFSLRLGDGSLLTDFLCPF